MEFLVALANELEAAVHRGMDAARRIGWNGLGDFWFLGGLHWAAYKEVASGSRRRHDLDDVSTGIAPAVKLLQAVVLRISELDSSCAQSFVRGWLAAKSPIHVRLWAVSALDGALVESEQIGEFVVDLADDYFWRLDNFPEIATLRALRFEDIGRKHQKQLVSRLRKGPPRSQWPTRADAKTVKSARIYTAVRELKRIQVAGGQLPTDSNAWLKSQIEEFPELDGMSIEEELPRGAEVYAVPPNPDEKYDMVEGIERLRELEDALSSGGSSWIDSDASRANDWINSAANAEIVLKELESAANGGDDFPRVWNRFGWAHSPNGATSDEGSVAFLQNHAKRVLELLERVSEVTLTEAIEGISQWFYGWRRYVSNSTLGLRIWLKVWPIAVAVTNSKSERRDEGDSGISIFDVDEDDERQELDTLNPPPGKLVSVFLHACPSLEEVREPFSSGSIARRMRDAVSEAGGGVSVDRASQTNSCFAVLLEGRQRVGAGIFDISTGEG